MKNLLFVLVILMLACGTDTEVVEETPPATEAADTKVFVVQEIGPNTPGDRGDLGPPRIIKSNIYPQNERVTFNSARLNEEGIVFNFNEDLHRFVIDLSFEGESLGWIPTAIRSANDVGVSITLTPPANGPFLEPGQEYLIDLLVGDKTGDVLELEIRFWTVP